MRRPIDGGASELVLRDVPPISDVRCPTISGRPCVLGLLDGDNYVFSLLDPVRGKGDMLGELKVARDIYPCWSISPDGSQVAVVNVLYRDRVEVLSVRDRTWREIRVQPGWGSILDMTWTPDGKGFYITSFPPKSVVLIHVDLHGKVRLMLSVPHERQIFHPVPSPDGKYLAIQTLTFDSNVWLLENAGGR